MLTGKEVEAVKKAVHGLRNIHHGLENAHHRLRLSNEVYETLVTEIGEVRAKELWSEICQAAKLTEYAFGVWEDEYGVGDDWSDEHKARDMAIEALTMMGVICDAVEGFKKKARENEWRY